MRWLGQLRPISLTLILGKRVEKLMQDAINGRIRAWNINSFLSVWLKSSRSCQTNLISFSDEITSLVDGGSGTETTDSRRCFTWSRDVLVKNLVESGLENESEERGREYCRCCRFAAGWWWRWPHPGQGLGSAGAAVPRCRGGLTLGAVAV